MLIHNFYTSDSIIKTMLNIGAFIGVKYWPSIKLTITRFIDIFYLALEKEIIFGISLQSTHNYFYL